MKILTVFFGLALANFMVQFFTQELYYLALERSYFQGIALFTYWLWLCTEHLAIKDGV